jgi:hypothetical protein
VVNIDGTAKAFTITNLKFFGENRWHTSFHDALRCPHFVHTIDVTWRFQKNGNNSEKKTLVWAFGHPTLCAVSALLHISKCWHVLGLPKEHPLAVYMTDGTINGKTKLICKSNINAALLNAARNVYNMKWDDLDWFTSHSICVGACVALHAANILVLNIQHALHWKSDAFLIYLHNLPCQAQCTARAVIEFNPHCLNLMSGTPAA